MDVSLGLYNELCLTAVDEPSVALLERPTADIAFTEHHVLKIYRSEYSRDNPGMMEFERNWDNAQLDGRCSLASAVLGGKVRILLVMPRISEHRNVEAAMLRSSLRECDLHSIADALLRMLHGWAARRERKGVSFKRHRTNLCKQIPYVRVCLPESLLYRVEQYIEHTAFLDGFRLMCDALPTCDVHGDAFSANLYASPGGVLVLDPITRGHIASVAHAVSDIAPFLCDVHLFFGCGIWMAVKNHACRGLDACECELLGHYELLKLLVRVRFALLDGNRDRMARETILSNAPVAISEVLDELGA